MRIVLDINVLISGIISKEAPPGQLLALWRDRQYVLVSSHPLINRMREVLSRPRLQPFVSAAESEALITDLLDAAVLVEPDPSVNLSSDPEDDIILGTAVAGQVDMLVSGDKKHLLPLNNVQGVPILDPSDALARVLASRTS